MTAGRSSSLRRVVWRAVAPIAAVLVISAAVSTEVLWASPPGATSAGFSYPLADIVTEGDLLARLMSGGCWLAGLPGRANYNGRNVHAGIDLRATLGDTIYAVAAGVVDPASDTIHSGYGPGWTPGYAVLVRCVLPDGTPYIVIYGHTQGHRVRGGERVVAGQALAQVGPWLPDQGGPHLHLTVRLGELPRYGWGTPTLAGQAIREGAEVVSCAADVEARGYRNPLAFLKGNSAPNGARPGPPVTPVPLPGVGMERFVAHATQYWRDSQKSCPKPLGDAFSRSAEPVRRGSGWLQTYGTQGIPTGALLLRDGSARPYWVGEPLWTIYNLARGLEELGYPVGEALSWPEADAQGFEQALLVVEKSTGRVHTVKRAR